MPRITIIPSDNAVYVDGVGISGIDCSTVPKGVHALQWGGVSGMVEFVDEDPFDNKSLTPEILTELPAYAVALEAVWQTAFAAQEAERQAAAELEARNTAPLNPNNPGSNAVVA
jgi:hypothetical protein